jgi:hypothetical protein
LKLCINCKYFISPDFFTDNKFGKCELFPKKIENGGDFYVTGEKEEEEIEYSYCSIARKNENNCGVSGKKYVKKQKD